MRTFDWRVALWQYLLPAAILLGSLAVMFALGGDPDMAWLLFVAPPLAFVTGFVFRPARTWVMPAIVAAVLAATIFVAAALDITEPELHGLRFVAGILFLGIVAVVLPLWGIGWLGRALAEEWGLGTHRPRGPRRPAPTA